MLHWVDILFLPCCLNTRNEVYFDTKEWVAGIKKYNKKINDIGY